LEEGGCSEETPSDINVDFGIRSSRAATTRFLQDLQDYIKQTRFFSTTPFLQDFGIRTSPIM
jgi:hypothetical protein